MNKLTFIKAGSIAFVVLGIAHLSVTAMGAPESEQLTRLLADMQNYKINLFGEHSLLKFHDGFSLMMGFLLSAFGAQNFVLSEAIGVNRKAQWTTIIITAISLIISVLYFHLLADGFILFALTCYGLALFGGSHK